MTTSAESPTVCEPCRAGDHQRCTSQGWGGCRCESCYGTRTSAAPDPRDVALCDVPITKRTAEWGRELIEAERRARRQALTEAWQAVDRAVRPLGTECGQSRWNAGYTQARDEAQNAILELRDRD